MRNFLAGVIRDSGAILCAGQQENGDRQEGSTSNDQRLDDLAYHPIDSFLSANRERPSLCRSFQRNSRFAFLNAKRPRDLIRFVWIERVERVRNDAGVNGGRRYPHRHCVGDPVPPPCPAALGRDVVSICLLLLCRKGLQSLPELCERIGGVGRADQVA